MSQCDPIASVVKLSKKASELGLHIIFITARPEEYRNATERNLRYAGYEDFTLIMRDKPLTSTVAAYKTPIRRQLVEDGYTIIANIGDQFGDIDGGFSERTFKIPNPFYITK